MSQPNLPLVPEGVRDAWIGLAERVRTELVRAGLPVVEEDTIDVAAGAVIEVDLGDDFGGGVFARWEPSPGLADLAANSVAAGEFEHPAVAHSGSVAAAMRSAIIDILLSAGIDAQESDDEIRPYSVQIMIEST